MTNGQDYLIKGFGVVDAVYTATQEKGKLQIIRNPSGDSQWRYMLSFHKTGTPKAVRLPLGELEQFEIERLPSRSQRKPKCTTSDLPKGFKPEIPARHYQDSPRCLETPIVPGSLDT